MTARRNRSLVAPEGNTVGDADLRAVRTALTAQAQELRHELVDIDSALSSLREDCELDAADVGVKTISLEQLRLQQDRAGAALSRTVAALGRLDDHSFGRCLDCGRQVDRERILAVPHAERCVRCEEAYGRL
ncbi:TraR/DksA C4-type zinc finger protein [Streptomyces sp. NPDC047022]|uniref:TraR/DksA family transcriptional regulator n=1 Tax=Streptomyces sp. NPDC047022 TaxID=3155737 RepID=UPI0033FBD8B3